VIIAHPDAPVGDGAAERFAADLDRRATGEPVAYIRGFKEFRGLAFGVDARALIPRPETERLVELAELEIVRRLIGSPRPAGSPPLRVVDVGVGSGAVAVTIAVLLRRRGMADEVALTGTDVSEEALQLARENAVAHAVGDRIAFVRADLLPGSTAERWDVVLANLPYVRSDAIDGLPKAASFEPVLALDGGPDGLRVIGRLLDQLPAALEPDGVALLEIGGDQDPGIRELVAERLPGWSCETETDLGGLPRVAIVRRDGSSAAP
jgi:release factor glutamine methyltransferase